MFSWILGKFETICILFSAKQPREGGQFWISTFLLIYPSFEISKVNSHLRAEKLVP